MSWGDRTKLLFFVLTFLGSAVLTLANAQTASPAASGSAQSDDASAAAAFEAIVPVLHHPRCMNCHSIGDYPRQGDDSHPHTMRVRRGPNGVGEGVVGCSSCHQEHNLTGVHTPPGAPDWHLPSPEMPMIWQGLSDH